MSSKPHISTRIRLMFFPFLKREGLSDLFLFVFFLKEEKKSKRYIKCNELLRKVQPFKKGVLAETEMLTSLKHYIDILTAKLLSQIHMSKFLIKTLYSDLFRT